MPRPDLAVVWQWQTGSTSGASSLCAPACLPTTSSERPRSTVRPEHAEESIAKSCTRAFPARHPAPGTAGTPPLARLAYHPFRGCRRGRGGPWTRPRVGK